MPCSTVNLAIYHIASMRLKTSIHGSGRRHNNNIIRKVPNTLYYDSLQQKRLVQH